MNRTAHTRSAAASLAAASLLALSACQDVSPVAPTASSGSTASAARGGPTTASRIFFARGEGGSWAIYAMNADGSGGLDTITRASDFSLATAPSLSPDRKRIAFVGQRVVAGAREQGVYVANADGTGAVLAVSGPTDMPAWSPDGKRIAYVGWHDQSTGQADIYVVDVDAAGNASNRVRLTTSFDWDYHPAWSPDGARIAFESSPPFPAWRYAIYVVDVANPATAPRRLTPVAESGNGDFSPAWSPDGKKIAFASTRDGQGEIYVMNADGARPVRLTSTPSAWEDCPAWSPDSRQIVFSRDVSGPMCDNGNWAAADLYVMSARGTNVAPLTTGPAIDVYASWR